MLKFLCETQDAAAGNDTGTRVVMTCLLVIVLVGMLVMPYFTTKKRNKEYEAMVNSLKAGDLVKTAGGIIGRIVKILNKGEINTVILETGSKTEKSYMEFDMNMIYCVLKSEKTEEDASVEDEEDEDEAEESVEEAVEAPVEEVKAEEVVETPAEEVAETETAEVVEETKAATEQKKEPTAKKIVAKKTTKKK